MLLGSDGTIHTKKISSSVDNYARAIVEGLVEVFREQGLSGADIEEIRAASGLAPLEALRRSYDFSTHVWAVRDPGGHHVR